MEEDFSQVIIKFFYDESYWLLSMRDKNVNLSNLSS